MDLSGCELLVRWDNIAAALRDEIAISKPTRMSWVPWGTFPSEASGSDSPGQETGVTRASTHKDTGTRSATGSYRSIEALG